MFLSEQTDFYSERPSVTAQNILHSVSITFLYASLMVEVLCCWQSGVCVIFLSWGKEYKSEGTFRSSEAYLTAALSVMSVTDAVTCSWMQNEWCLE